MRNRRWFWSGILLLAVSSWPLFLQLREWFLGALYERRYESASIYSNRAAIGAAVVELSDSAGDGRTDLTVVHAPVRITINGRDYSSPSMVPIQVRQQAENRYPGVQLVLLKDKRTGGKLLVVDQFVGEVDTPDRWTWRLLIAGPSGGVREERFTYAERAWPLYRSILASITGPQQVGRYSDINTYWPTIFFPLAYPWLTTVLSLVMTATAWIRSRFSKR